MIIDCKEENVRQLHDRDISAVCSSATRQFHASRSSAPEIGADTVSCNRRVVHKPKELNDLRMFWDSNVEGSDAGATCHLRIQSRASCSLTPVSSIGPVRPPKCRTRLVGGFHVANSIFKLFVEPTSVSSHEKHLRANGPLLRDREANPTCWPAIWLPRIYQFPHPLRPQPTR
jgi:hypothetical protein